MTNPMRFTISCEIGTTSLGKYTLSKRDELLRNVPAVLVTHPEKYPQQTLPAR
jgi:hypothetical protein